MKFDDLDSKMRVFETAHDHCVLPGLWMVARIDGRGFTKLTKDEMQYEAPFDERFRDLMVETVKHCMDCGFRALYGYTESDEISILLHKDENAFGRKLRKYNSVLAGEASAAFTHLIGRPAAFDCRISQLPTEEDVVTYFRWRNEDASRNALNGHCYWMLRKEGVTATAATRQLKGLGVAPKNEMLFKRGVNFNELPLWQRRGIGIYPETYTKEGRDPRYPDKVIPVTRTRLKIDMELPMKEAYGEFVRKFLKEGK
jgi:tRNA(His) 5'-end guanylyltransferase